MARYIITTRRQLRGSVPSAEDVVTGDSRVKVVNSTDPDMVTVDANKEVGDELREKLKDTHYVEPEIRRGLT